MNSGWQLVDSHKRQVKSPRTWAHTPDSALDRIVPGWFVKIAVENPALTDCAAGERFWAQVLSRNDGGFRVKIDNDLLLSASHGLKFGDRLTVDRQHIFGVLNSNGSTIWEAKAEGRNA